MYVHYKQSGELLTSDPDQRWTPDAVRASAEKIRMADMHRAATGMEGLLVVSGAGNIARGDQLRKQGLAIGMEDVLGRLATIENTVVLKSALDQARVATTVMVASSMGFKDDTFGSLDPYSPEALKEAYDRERVVLIAGGTGEDKVTTDNAVLTYALLHQEAFPEDKTLVLKGTKFDGIFDRDPSTHGDARRYRRISAGVMLADYERYKAVDRTCLEQLVRHPRMSMCIYQDAAHDLVTVIQSSTNGQEVGTVVTGEPNIEQMAY